MQLKQSRTFVLNSKSNGMVYYTNIVKSQRAAASRFGDSSTRRHRKWGIAPRNSDESRRKNHEEAQGGREKGRFAATSSSTYSPAAFFSARSARQLFSVSLSTLSVPDRRFPLPSSAGGSIFALRDSLSKTRAPGDFQHPARRRWERPPSRRVSPFSV